MGPITNDKLDGSGSGIGHGKGNAKRCCGMVVTGGRGTSPRSEELRAAEKPKIARSPIAQRPTAAASSTPMRLRTSLIRACARASTDSREVLMPRTYGSAAQTIPAP